MMRPLKIAFLVSEFPSVSETFVLNQIAGLLELGHEVTILSSQIGKADLLHPTINEYGLMNRVRRLTQVDDYGDFDIIHAHFGPNGIAALQLLKRQQISGKIVVSFHAFDLSLYPKVNGRDVYREVFESADLLMPVSIRGAKRLVDLGASEAKIKIHRMGVDVEQFRFRIRSPEIPIRLTMISRLVPKKGIDVFLDTLYRLKAERFAFSAQVVGEGPALEKLLERRARLDLENHIEFKGARASGEIIKLLDQTDVLVAPSRTSSSGDEEGIPVTLMEAMASGVSVVASDHAAIPELVKNEKTGYLVPENDSEALAKTLQGIAEDPQRIRILEAARARIVQDHNIQKLNRELSEIYRALLEQT